MKKLFFQLRRNVISLAGILAIILLISACKKSLDTAASRIPTAGIMAFNLVPDKESVGIAVSGQSLTNFPLRYTNYTGGYLGIYTGNRDLTSYDFNSGTILASASQLFADSSNYSVFAVGVNGKYRNVIVKDNLDSLPSTTGEAFIRYVNAIPDSTMQPVVTIASNGTNVFSNNSTFTSVSDFKGVTPGDISIKVNSEPSVNSSRTITVEKGKIYTILLVGLPGQTDSARAVQIKFIQNGAVSSTP